jgi:hypothetical protein
MHLRGTRKKQAVIFRDAAPNAGTDLTTRLRGAWFAIRLNRISS